MYLWCAQGYSWMGCHDAYCGSPPFKPPCNAHGQTKINWQFPTELERDYGEPVGWGDGKGGYCVETSEEVFERSYTHAHIQLSCKDGSSTITMKADDENLLDSAHLPLG